MRQDNLDTSLLTIAQAKDVWCPDARVLQQEVSPVYPGIDGANRLATAPASCNRASLREVNSVTIEPSKAAMCLGDGCMFWRWHDSGPRPQATRDHHHDTLADTPGTRPGGAWKCNVGTYDCGDREWFDDVYTAWMAATSAGGPDSIRLADYPCEWAFFPDDLPPRGYCGKAGHPHQARLLEAQLKLLQHQLHEHRRGE
ncbi:hypothetical protein [Methylobacterium sp. 391_Methyba4]|uniref:hypothetical protein n=1 Tax=Methylobacterium sp. 391_Methyba4 TaxID=3038924 RepID=UPI00241FBB52|nr:hypothetical protein [Methylobacterium sp. 391_Methyba4]WFS05354.1 hypothetical protein P9K36_18175 [Methylobacterium sp. 391_Methyba4]